MPSLVQIMAYKPLSEPILSYYQLDPLEQTSVSFYQKLNILIKKINLKMSAKWWPFSLASMF